MIPWWIALAAFAAGEIFGIVVLAMFRHRDRPRLRDRPKSKYFR